MAITRDLKKEIIKTYQKHPKDTGSAEVQAAVLTKKINELADHLSKNPKDNAARKGLLGMVGRRRKNLKYIETKNKGKYEDLVQKLQLRK